MGRSYPYFGKLVFLAMVSKTKHKQYGTIQKKSCTCIDNGKPAWKSWRQERALYTSLDANKQTNIVILLTEYLQTKGFSLWAFWGILTRKQPGHLGCFSQHAQLETICVFSAGSQGQGEKEWHMCLHSQRLKYLADLTCIWIPHYHQICFTDTGFSNSWV